MESTYPNPIQIWKDFDDQVDQDLFGTPGADFVKNPLAAQSRFSADRTAEDLYLCEALRPRSGKKRPDECNEPYSLQWFLNIENQRHRRYAPWIPRLLEFHKHKGESLLGLGHGLGTDWVQYSNYGASVTVCSSCQSQLEIVKRHFHLRGLTGRFIHSTPDALPLAESSIDVACINGLLQRADNPTSVVQEVLRVLKPGGKVIAVTPAKYDVDYWKDRLLFGQNWLGKQNRETEEVQRRFSWRRLRRLFADFEEHRIRKRQLHRSEVPYLWRLIPRSALERIIGHVLVLKAFKPFSSNKSSRIAA